MIKKRKNKHGVKTFQARVKFNGQAVYKSFAVYQDAVTWINEKRYLRDHRNTRPLIRVTVEELFSNYMDTARNKGNAPSSLKKAEFTLKNHILPFYGDMNLLNVSINEHKAFIQGIREKGLQNSTVNRSRSLMAAMYSVAIKESAFQGAITTNPWMAIRPAKEMNRRLDYFNQEEIFQFLASEQSSPYYPLWVLMFNTGLRIGEAVAIHGEQVDRYAHILTVDRLWCITSNTIRMETKGCRIREVGINQALQPVLYPRVRQGLLFTTGNGEQLRTDTVSKKVFPKACKRAGVRNIGVHGLRHTYASHYMMNGGNLYDLQKILGHSDIKTTERYAHFNRLHIQKRSNIVGFGGRVIEVNFQKKELISA